MMWNLYSVKTSYKGLTFHNFITGCNFIMSLSTHSFDFVQFVTLSRTATVAGMFRHFHLSFSVYSFFGRFLCHFFVNMLHTTVYTFLRLRVLLYHNVTRFVSLVNPVHWRQKLWNVFEIICWRWDQFWTDSYQLLAFLLSLKWKYR